MYKVLDLVSAVYRAVYKQKFDKAQVLVAELDRILATYERSC